MLDREISLDIEIAVDGEGVAVEGDVTEGDVAHVEGVPAALELDPGSRRVDVSRDVGYIAAELDVVLKRDRPAGLVDTQMVKLADAAVRRDDLVTRTVEHDGRRPTHRGVERRHVPRNVDRSRIQVAGMLDREVSPDIEIAVDGEGVAVEGDVTEGDVAHVEGVPAALELDPGSRRVDVSRDVGYIAAELDVVLERDRPTGLVDTQIVQLADAAIRRNDLVTRTVEDDGRRTTHGGVERRHVPRHTDLTPVQVAGMFDREVSLDIEIAIDGEGVAVEGDVSEGNPLRSDPIPVATQLYGRVRRVHFSRYPGQVAVDCQAPVNLKSARGLVVAQVLERIGASVQDLVARARQRQGAVAVLEHTANQVDVSLDRHRARTDLQPSALEQEITAHLDDVAGERERPPRLHQAPIDRQSVR